MTEQFITYFGYGSLVNRDTRPVGEQAAPARLRGWRRVWGHRVQRSDVGQVGSTSLCCSLTIEKTGEKCADRASPNGIDGVVVTIPISELPVLDAREAGYDRVKLPASAFDLPSTCASESIYVYVSDSAHAGRSNTQFPILQSYIDCVLAGYCAVFNEDGMQQFVDSTAGWNGAIDNDRHEPRYPRAVRLPPSELSRFDDVVAKAVLSCQD